MTREPEKPGSLINAAFDKIWFLKPNSKIPGPAFCVGRGFFVWVIAFKRLAGNHSGIVFSRAASFGAPQ